MDSRLFSGRALVLVALTLGVACGDSSSSSDPTDRDAAALADATLDASFPDDSPNDAAVSDSSTTDEGRDPHDALVADAPSTADGGDGSAVDAEAGATGPVSNPGRVACAGGTCDTTVYELCCFAPGAEGGAEHCTKDTSGCALTAQCDEKADCWAGTVCCAGPSSVAGNWMFSRSCITASAGVCEFNGGFQLCKTDAECGTSVCTIKTCTASTFASCGPLPAWYHCK